MGVVGIKGNCYSGFTILWNADNFRGAGVLLSHLNEGVGSKDE